MLRMVYPILFLIGSMNQQARMHDVVNNEFIPWLKQQGVPAQATIVNLPNQKFDTESISNYIHDVNYVNPLRINPNPLSSFSQGKKYQAVMPIFDSAQFPQNTLSNANYDQKMGQIIFNEGSFNDQVSNRLFPFQHELAHLLFNQTGEEDLTHSDNDMAKVYSLLSKDKIPLSVSNKMSLTDIYKSRPDLQKAFPNSISYKGNPSKRLIRWWNKYGIREYPNIQLQ